MMSLMFDTNPAPASCESCGWLTCPGCEDDMAIVMRLCREDAALQAEAALLPEVEEQDDGCGCGVVGDEDVTCERCREFERDEMVGGAM
jgi:hypothetical protein